MTDEDKKLHLSDEEWKKRLTHEQYEVLRQKKTECAFSGGYVDSKQKGYFVCAACKSPLFTSSAKYDSGSGWPSFWQPINSHCLDYKEDFHIGYKRIEVLCHHCEGHLGHVFEDGPLPTGRRYCINSVALIFMPN